MITVADIEAMYDVLDRLAETSDELPAADAVLIDKALTALQSKVRSTQSLVQTQAIKSMDGQPIAVGGSVFVAKSTGKERPNHDAIKALVARRAAVDRDTGEVLKGVKAVPRAVAQAIESMYGLFVSDSTKPKVGGVEALGATMADVTRWERTGTKIEEVVVDGGRD